MLQDLLRAGLARNLDLRLAAARVIEARELAGIAKSFRYPQVNVGFGYSAAQASRLADPPLSKETAPIAPTRTGA